MRSSRYKKNSLKPLKSSFQKRKTKFRVKWSPDVKNIVRTSEKNPRKCRAHHSKLLLKIQERKTDYDTGKLYAEKQKNNLFITLFNKYKKLIGMVKVNILTRQIVSIRFSGFSISKAKKDDTKVKVKMKFELGDVIWIHGDKKVKRNPDCKGYDISWLNNIIKLYAHVSNNTVHNKYRNSKRSSSKEKETCPKIKKYSSKKKKSYINKNIIHKIRSKALYSPKFLKQSKR